MHLDDTFGATGGSLFEPAQCILALSLAASFCFVVSACLRWNQLQKACIKIGSSHQASIKIYMSGTNSLINPKAFNFILLVIQSSIVGVSVSVPTESSHILVEVAHLVAAVGLVNLSSRDHYRSVSPSKPLVVYLSIRTFLNISALLLVHGRGFTTFQALRTIIEVGNLIAESQNKRHYLLEPFLDVAPEDTAGLWSKASFAWVTPILLVGNGHSFSLENLPRNPHRFDPSSLRQTILLAWNQRAKPEAPLTLPLILVQCLMPEFATIVPTRFMLIVFRYAQPLLISNILQLLASNALGGQSYQLSCTIVIISTVVYIGQAIISSRYRHELNRLKIITRAALVELIYEKTLSTPSTTYKDYSTVTLMSTDVDALEGVSEMFHEAWAQVFEVIVGMILLAQQIGWFCIIPLPMIYGKLEDVLDYQHLY
ncbi:hypothetical protein E4T44_08251 [Aureobasidium sp. EXF-8845]|nr:hypothetical protein E4T44_08251 [Aureobasidium sp. EXF-8845]KAI4844427.1 hypothetical protein E4T45_08159 [Aureobasidium sp. EXF-8846]